MAASNGNGAVPALVKDTLEKAQKRLQSFNKEAEKLAKEFLARSRTAQKEFTREFEQLRKRVAKSDLLDRPRIKEIRGRALAVRNDVVGQLEALQTKTLNAVGVASREQVSTIADELKRLTRKVESMTKSGRKGKNSGTVGA